MSRDPTLVLAPGIGSTAERDGGPALVGLAAVAPSVGALLPHAATGHDRASVGGGHTVGPTRPGAGGGLAAAGGVPPATQPQRSSVCP